MEPSPRIQASTRYAYQRFYLSGSYGLDRAALALEYCRDGHGVPFPELAVCRLIVPLHAAKGKHASPGPAAKPALFVDAAVLAHLPAACAAVDRDRRNRSDPRRARRFNPHINLLIATALGVGLTVLLGTGLMTLAFLSSSSGHDEQAAPHIREDDDE